MTMVDFMRNGTYTEFFSTVTAGYQMMYMLDKSCNFEDLFFNIVNWCENNDCSLETIGQNGLGNIFYITALMNDLAAVTLQGTPIPTNDTVSYFTMMNKVGNDVGKITNYLISYGTSTQ
jgi:hypothetical protein